MKRIRDRERDLRHHDSENHFDHLPFGNKKRGLRYEFYDETLEGMDGQMERKVKVSLKLFQKLTLGICNMFVQIVLMTRKIGKVDRFFWNNIFNEREGRDAIIGEVWDKCSSVKNGMSGMVSCLTRVTIRFILCLQWNFSLVLDSFDRRKLYWFILKDYFY